MSNTAEVFLTIRSEFAKSLAISSIFGYILGIGDRHLDNLLMDAKRGSIVQIDFGICFGMVIYNLTLLSFFYTPITRKCLVPDM